MRSWLLAGLLSLKVSVLFSLLKLTLYKWLWWRCWLYFLLEMANGATYAIKNRLLIQKKWVLFRES